MKEIKFQVFAKDWEGIEKCFDGYFIHLLDDGRYRVAFTNSDSDKEFITVDRDKVRFFTGLHDKNGKEIYEGDVLNYRCGGTVQATPYKVESAFELWRQIGEGEGDSYYSMSGFEVIGNIYEGETK